MIKLAPRERQIVEMLVDGKRGKEIAQDLGIGEGTVKGYMSNAMKKAGANDRTHLVVMFLRGLVAALVIAAVAMAQQAGTVTQATTTTITATAGTVTCVMTSATPALPTGVHVECTESASGVTSKSDAPSLPEGGVFQGSYGRGSDLVTWMITHPAGQASLAWQVAANGTSKSGAF